METNDNNPDTSKRPGRPPGTPKSGGRQKGTPNKVTKAVRGTLVKFINRNIRTIQRDFDKLDPKDRLTMIEKFLPYIVPKQSSIKAEIADLTDDEIESVAARILNEIKNADD